MNTESSGMSNKDDDVVKLIGGGALVIVILVVVIIGMLSGVEKTKPNYPVCDYCKTAQRDAKPFPCRQCGKTHLSCGRESGLRALDARKDKEGIALGRSIKVCPGGDAR